MAPKRTKSASQSERPRSSGDSPAHVVREWGESLGIALVLALVLRHFVVEAFKIPTKSMEPTLVGDTSSGDKILVSKFMYDFTRPERGDVIVFKFPEDPYKNFIKRLIGLPNEEIRIWGGDVYVDQEIWRKPESVQRVLWMPVTNDALIWDEIADASLRGSSELGEIPNGAFPKTFAEVEKWQSKYRGERDELVAKRRTQIWRPDDGGTWESTADGLRVRPGNGGSSMTLATYHERRVRDRILTDTGHLKQVYRTGIDRVEWDWKKLAEGRRHRRPLATVDDLSIRFRARPEGSSGKVLARLEDSRRELLAEVPVGQPAPLAVHIVAKGASEPQTISGPEFAMRKDKTTRIAFQNVDNSIILEINGKRLIYHEYPQVPETAKRPGSRVQASLGVTGVPASFRQVRLERDVYYWAELYAPRAFPRPWENALSWKLGEREYFVLGDNSPNSKDSRLWQSPGAPEENLIGEAFMVFWPPKRVRIIR